MTIENQFSDNLGRSGNSAKFIEIRKDQKMPSVGGLLMRFKRQKITRLYRKVDQLHFTAWSKPEHEIKRQQNALGGRTNYEI